MPEDTAEGSHSRSIPRYSDGGQDAVKNITGVDTLARGVRHYRTMYSGSVQPLDDLSTFRGFFRSLHGTIMGLQSLYLCGYVHKDVSSANVLLKDMRRGTLVDLEYMDSTPSAHQSAAGTRQFMSIEVVKQKRVYPKLKRAVFSEVVEVPPWKHHPLHDLDSVWWISVWLIYMYAEEGTERIASQDTDGLARGDFSPTYNRVIWNVIVKWRFDIYNSFVTTRGTPNEEPTVEIITRAYEAALKRVGEVLALDDSILYAPLSRMYR